MQLILRFCRPASHFASGSLTATLGLLFFALSTTAGFSQNQEEVFPNLSGNDLLSALQANFSATGPLDYGIARDTMFLNVWRKDGKLACEYTDFEVDLPNGVDPTEFVFDQGINTEHLYPRSKGAGSGNALADMHHLYPTREGVNSDRASLPFADINDSQTNKWYFRDQTLTSPPATNVRDNYSEWNGASFEPREIRKGDIARAMMYFFTIYRNQALADDPDFFNQQRQTLCLWNDLDPVDMEEYIRSQKIATFQGNENPFILDCTLANRIGYCPEVSQACLLLDNEESAFAKTPSAFPNPSTGSVTLTDLPINTKLVLIDALGRQLQTYSHVLGNLEGTTTATLVLPKGLNTGCYTLVEMNTGWSHRIIFSGQL